MDLPGDEPARAFSRHMRCLPVLIVPMKGTEYFEHDEIMFAPTKDFSDLGLSFIANKPINTPEVLCGVWTDHPQLLHALVRRSKPFGGDLHEIGIEFTEVIESSQIVGLLKDDLARLNIDGHSG